MKLSIGFIGLLTIVFVLLKAFNKIDWSWFWVFSPLWIGALILTAIFLIILIVNIIIFSSL